MQKRNKPLSASLIYETLPDGTEAGNGISNPVDGAFKIVLPYDKNYSIQGNRRSFLCHIGKPEPRFTYKSGI